VIVDEIRRARAIMGVPPTVSGKKLRKRYRQLVKRWHPDRYASDPIAQIEAAARMREINDVYRILIRAMNAQVTVERTETVEDPHLSDHVWLLLVLRKGFLARTHI
jgi:preprotein translocase subunit Sec63